MPEPGREPGFLSLLGNIALNHQYACSVFCYLLLLLLSLLLLLLLTYFEIPTLI